MNNVQGVDCGTDGPGWSEVDPLAPAAVAEDGRDIENRGGRKGVEEEAACADEGRVVVFVIAAAAAAAVVNDDDYDDDDDDDDDDDMTS